MVAPLPGTPAAAQNARLGRIRCREGGGVAGRVLQAIETPREFAFLFDGGASEPRIYAYVGNDPLNLTDPLGLCDNPQGCGGGGVGGLLQNLNPIGTAQAQVLPVPGIAPAPAPAPGGMVTNEIDQSAQALSNAITNAVHGNSLDSQRQTYVYQLTDRTTGDILKYGITSQPNPQARYPAAFYEQNNAQMQVITSYSNRGFARAHELALTGGYFLGNGALPPLSSVP